MVVGSGLMGSGIAQVCAQAGIKVFLYDISKETLEKALKTIDWSVGKFIEKGKLTEEKDTIIKRIEVIEDLKAGASANLIIEAVFENLELKQKIFGKLDQICDPQTFIASNTSAIPISEIASVTNRSDKILGLHFFSPVPMMQAVEVIKGIATSDDTFQQGRDFVFQIGKEPIMVHRDVPGFVINRINWPSTIEAMNLVEQGVASVEDIDKGLRLASGRRMGIFETGDARWYPPLLLRRKVKAGHLGRKTGRGWYQYDEAGNKKA